MNMRRVLAALAGVLLLAAALYFGFGLGRETYYDYYVLPKFKDAYIMPTRWQDIVTFIGLWSAVFSMLYASYRSLNYALRAQ